MTGRTPRVAVQPFGRPVLHGTYNSFCSQPCVHVQIETAALNGADRYVNFTPLHQLTVHFAYMSV